MEHRFEGLTDYHLFQWPSLLLLQWSLSFTDWWCILGQCLWYPKDTPTLRLWLKAVVSSACCIFTLHYYPMVWCCILGQCLWYLKDTPTLLLWLKAVVSSACCIFTIHCPLVLYFRSLPSSQGHSHIAFMMENSGKQCMAALIDLPFLSCLHVFLACNGWCIYFGNLLVCHCVL